MPDRISRQLLVAMYKWLEKSFFQDSDMPLVVTYLPLSHSSKLWLAQVYSE